MVECAALEMRYTGNRIEGSNPSLSATGLFKPIQSHPKVREKLHNSAICDSYAIRIHLPLTERKWV